MLLIEGIWEQRRLTASCHRLLLNASDSAIESLSYLFSTTSLSLISYSLLHLSQRRSNSWICAGFVDPWFVGRRSLWTRSQQPHEQTPIHHRTNACKSNARSHRFQRYLENYAGLDPLGNLVAPKNQLAQIRTVRANNGQKSGNWRVVGGPGGI